MINAMPAPLPIKLPVSVENTVASSASYPVTNQLPIGGQYDCLSKNIKLTVPVAMLPMPKIGYSCLSSCQILMPALLPSGNAEDELTNLISLIICFKIHKMTGSPPPSTSILTPNKKYAIKRVLKNLCHIK